jgi:hypothetical protein
VPEENEEKDIPNPPVFLVFTSDNMWAYAPPMVVVREIHPLPLFLQLRGLPILFQNS